MVQHCTGITWDNFLTSPSPVYLKRFLGEKMRKLKSCVSISLATLRFAILVIVRTYQ